MCQLDITFHYVSHKYSDVIQMSVTGWCSNSTLLNDGQVTFAYDWCPYKYAWLCIIGLALYLLCFSPGELTIFFCCIKTIVILILQPTQIHMPILKVCYNCLLLDRYGPHAMDYK